MTQVSEPTWNYALEKDHNSLVLKIVLLKHAAAYTLEVHMLDDSFLLACLKEICVTKKRKIHETNEKWIKQNKWKLVHTRIVTLKVFSLFC